MILFLDSSALAKRYMDEPGSDRVEELCGEANQLVLCVICLPEVISGLRRMQRRHGLSEQQFDIAKKALLADVEDATVCDLTTSVVRRSIELLEQHKLRAMDALHLAAAMAWGVDRFVSGDRRQLEAAQQEEIETIDVFQV